MTYATAPILRRKLAPFVLLAIVTVLALGSCGNLGEFDEEDVARQAEQYYAEKYGDNAHVVDVWEDRSYALFGYQSSGRAFCTMSDGQTVLVDFEDGVVGDNRQQDEVTAAYEQRFREELEGCCERLGDAGCEVASVWVNGVPLEEDGFFEGCISTHYWPEDPAGEKNGEVETTVEQSASFFYARYTGDDSFFEQEASRVSLGVPYIKIELSGADADYADGFPTDVPETPAWVAPIEGACRALLPLTDGDAETRVVVYQAGCRDGVPEDTDAAVLSDAENGKLGELSPFDDSDTGADDIGSWLIVEWFPVGKGVYVTSDECGVRLRTGDVELETVESPVSLEERVPSRWRSSRRVGALSALTSASSHRRPLRPIAWRWPRTSLRVCRRACRTTDGLTSDWHMTTRTRRRALQSWVSRRATLRPRSIGSRRTLPPRTSTTHLPTR